jgi:hypothetical protein
MNLKPEERIREGHKQNFFVVHGAAAGPENETRHTANDGLYLVEKEKIHDP